MLFTFGCLSQVHKSTVTRENPESNTSGVPGNLAGVGRLPILVPACNF